MNFADALRKAAQNTAHLPKHVPYEAPDFSESNATAAAEFPVETAPEAPMNERFESQPDRETAATPELTPEREAETTVPEFAVPTAGDPAATIAFDAITSEAVSLPEAPQGSVRAGNVVRLELFLSPEQLSGLFRALIATQHGMMTLREAATYLRVNAHAVEQMAVRGEIPALLIDGRWRFPKSSLDEWSSVQVFKNQGASDAA